MLVTGYQLKESLKLKGLELDTLVSQFDDNLEYFEGDEKPDPVKLANDITKIENDIAALQTAQSYFNLNTTVSIKALGQTTLEEAIKLVGGYGRKAKLFRNAAKGERRDRYHSGLSTRSKDIITAKYTMTRQMALEEAKKAESVAARLRSAIAIANSKEKEIERVEESMLA